MAFASAVASAEMRVFLAVGDLEPAQLETTLRAEIGFDAWPASDVGVLVRFGGGRVVGVNALAADGAGLPRVDLVVGGAGVADEVVVEAVDFCRQDRVVTAAAAAEKPGQLTLELEGVGMVVVGGGVDGAAGLKGTEDVGVLGGKVLKTLCDGPVLVERVVAEVALLGGVGGFDVSRHEAAAEGEGCVTAREVTLFLAFEHDGAQLEVFLLKKANFRGREDAVG